MIADAQDGLWYVVWMPVAFVAYLVGVLGFAVRGPLAGRGGRRPRRRGAGRAVRAPTGCWWWSGRHALLGAGAAVAVPLFLGGGAGRCCPAAAWVLVKAAVLTAGAAGAAGGCPACVPTGSMEPAWVVLLPLVVLQDLVVAVVVVGGAEGGAEMPVLVDVAFWLCAVVAVVVRRRSCSWWTRWPGRRTPWRCRSSPSAWRCC